MFVAEIKARFACLRFNRAAAQGVLVEVLAQRLGVKILRLEILSGVTGIKIRVEILRGSGR